MVQRVTELRNGAVFRCAEQMSSSQAQDGWLREMLNGLDLRMRTQSDCSAPVSRQTKNAASGSLIDMEKGQVLRSAKNETVSFIGGACDLGRTPSFGGNATFW